MDSAKFSALLRSVEHGSLTKAAEELGYTQAGLTHMMNRLEKEIGLTLLQRTKSGVTLTADGEELLPFIKDFTQKSLLLENAIANLKSSNEKVIRIAAYASITSHWMPLIMSKFKEAFPNVKIELHVGYIDDIVEMIENGEIDLGFVSRQENIHGDWIHLQNDPLYAVLPPDSDFDGECVPISYLDGKQFFMPTYGFDYDISNTLRSNNAKPIISPTVLDDAAIVSMVSHGLGFSILPKLVINNINAKINAKPLAPSSHRELGILIKSKNALSPTAHKFINYCKQTVKEI